MASHKPMIPFPPRIAQLVIVIVLAILVLVVFSQVGRHDFINVDDNVYVTDNLKVNSGLSWSNIRWAFTTTYASNWHPVTWLSHMTDVELFGLEAGKHHLISVLFHLLNTLLLFFVLMKMTGDLYPSGAVVALFAIHPFHVESVAWVAERKDVLSTFFAFLAIGAYWWYSNRPSVGRYLPVAVLFAVGLMAKPMVMTLPFILLLLDFWPLGRLMRSESADFEPRGGFWRAIDKPVLLEKIPLFAMTVMSAVVTYLAQRGGASVSKVYPLGIRIANALASCLDYVVKTFYPVRLAFFYPHPGSGVSSLKAVLGAGLIVAVTAVVLTAVRKAPYLLVGWFWFLGSLVPVIGLIQVGSQAMADRYTYVPIIGIFVLGIWGIWDFSFQWRYRKIFLSVAGGLVLILLMAMARVQVGYWHDGRTLFERALEVTSNNAVAHVNLGAALDREGKVAEAVTHYSRALEINPDIEWAYNNLGVNLANQGRIDEAIIHFSKAIKIRPTAMFHYNMGKALTLKGKYSQSVDHYRRALHLQPNYPEVMNDLGNSLALMGDYEKAVESFKNAIDLSPRLVKAYISLGAAYNLLNQPEKAAEVLIQAVSLNYNQPDAHFQLGLAYHKLGKREEALKEYRLVKNLDPVLAKELWSAITNGGNLIGPRPGPGW